MVESINERKSSADAASIDLWNSSWGQRLDYVDYVADK